MRDPAETIAQRTAAAGQTPISESERSPKTKKIRKKRPWPLKILLELVAILLCLALFAVTLAGALMTDLRVLTSQGGIERILAELLSPSLTASADASRSASGTGSVVFSSSRANSGALFGSVADMAYDYLSGMLGQELPVSKEEFTDFIEDSTLTEFIAGKLSGAIADFTGETNNTTITRQELLDLIRENAPLIQDTFGVSVTEEHLEQFEQLMEGSEAMRVLEQEGLTGILEQSGILSPSDTPAIGASPDLSAGVNTLKQAMQTVDRLSSDQALLCAAAAVLLLMLLIFAVNRTVPKTLSDIGITLFFAGLILSSVNILAAHGVLQALLGEQLAVLGMVSGVLSAVAPVHYSILGTGIALIILAIVVKAIQGNRAQAKSM